MSLLLTGCAATMPREEPSDSDVFSSVYSQRLEIDGCSVHYYDTHPSGGAAAQMLLIPGWLGSAVNFHGLLGSLPSPLRVLVPDLPGFGLSDKPEDSLTMSGYLDFLEKFVVETGLHSFMILGSSMGALLGMHYTARHPEKIERIILINPFGLREDGKGIRFLSRNRAIVALASHVVSDRFVANTVRHLFFLDPEKTPPEISEAYLHLFHTESGRQTVIDTTVRLIGSGFMDDLLPGITQSTLIIKTKKDRLAAEGNVQRYRDLLPNVAIVFLNNCGHMPSAENPEETAAIIRGFLP